MSESLEHIIQFDQDLFLWLNGQHDHFWDVVMSVFTNKITWIPLYMLLLYGLISKFKTKAIGYILCIVAVVILSDQVASTLFKPYFMRLRPCHDPMIAHLMHLVNGCGGKYGFVSSHAATGFGIAMIVNLLPTRRLTGTKWLFLWAFIYSYSRIYVGVHYPLDILIGGLVGIVLAIISYWIYNLSLNLKTPTFFERTWLKAK